MSGIVTFASEVRSRISDVVQSGLASHDTLTGTLRVAQIVQNPVKTLSFAFFMTQIYPDLKEPRETEDASDVFSVQDLSKFQICARLSEIVYCDEPSGLLPLEAGPIIFNPKVTSGLTPFFVTESPNSEYFVSFRGSYCFSDFLTDINANADAVYGGLMHSGVLTAAAGAYAILEGFVCQKFAIDHSKRFIFTGHSLGAAIAATITHRFRLEHPEIATEAVIFAPACSVNRKLWLDSTAYCTTFVLAGDFVPYLSLHNCADLLVKYVGGEFSRNVQKKLDRQTRNHVLKSPVRDFENPFLKEPPSIDEIRSDCERLSSHGTIALYPAGKLFLYELSGGMFRQITLRAITDCGYFGELVKGLSEDFHASSKYAECARELAEQAKRRERH
jgi:predicted esterase